MSLSLSVRRCMCLAVADVTGEIDITSAPWLQGCLLGQLRASGTRLVVDLSGVTFIDCGGLRTLIATCHRAEQKGCSVCFTALSRQVQRVAGLTGMLAEMPLAPPAPVGPADVASSADPADELVDSERLGGATGLGQRRLQLPGQLGGEIVGLTAGKPLAQRLERRLDEALGPVSRHSRAAGNLFLEFLVIHSVTLSAGGGAAHHQEM